MSSHEIRDRHLDRRGFLRRAAGALGGAAFIGAASLSCKKEPTATTATGTPAAKGGPPAKGAQPAPRDLVIVRNAGPAELVAKAFDSLGGLGRFVKAGQKVCLKPNAAWSREAGSGACTNPEVVDALIDLLLGAGVVAKDITVFEHTRDAFASAISWNGLEDVCTKRSVMLVDGTSQANYEPVDPVEGTKYLKPFNEREEVALDLLDADVVINMPVLKSHSATELSMGLKNLMGAIYNPRRYHGGKDADAAGGEELNERIADLAMLLKDRITLTLLDATYVLTDSGPKGIEGMPGDEKRTVVLGTDLVAVDSAGAQIFGMAPDQVGHVKAAAARGIGEMDLDKLRAGDRLVEVDLAGAGAAPVAGGSPEEPGKSANPETAE